VRDNWKGLVKAGIQARKMGEAGDRMRASANWQLGDLACTVETHYADHTLQQFASAIGVHYPTLLNLRTTARAYESSRRREDLSYGHHQEVQALPDRDEWLEKAAAGDWSCEELHRQSRAPRDGDDDFTGIDRAEELQKKWGTELGQVWVVGPHRIMCGDATNAEDVARLLDGAKPLLCVTDPPYGVEYDPAWRNKLAKNGQLGYGARRVGRVPNDDRIDWREAWALVPSDVLFVWHAGIYAGTVQIGIEAEGFVIRSQIIWAKPHFVISRGNYHCQHEPCWYAVRKGATAHWVGDRKQTTVWEIKLDRNAEGGHSTQKPVECMERPMRNHEGDVYDPFLGSGTTAVAADRQGRRCYGLDISPAYVAVTLERLAAMGYEPKLETSATQSAARNERAREEKAA
jgi:DNA modification methylase